MSKLNYGQMLHISTIAAVESLPTDVDGIIRLGVAAPDLEGLIGELSATPTEYTVMSRLDAIKNAIGTTNSKDLATETTLTAIKNKLILAPATEAKQDTANTYLSTIAGKDYATQTTLLAIQNKLITAPATEAKQDSTNTILTAIRDTAGIKKILDAVDISDRAARVLGTVTTVDGGNATAGAKADTAVADYATAASQTALLKGLIKQLQGAGTGSNPVYLTDTSTVLPVDRQAIFKTEAVLTTANLSGNATYTSAWVDVRTFKRLLVLLAADQSGTLYVEHSRDGIAARRTRTVAFTAGTPQALEEPCYSGYVRLVYTNGASAQGSFELSAMVSAD